MSNNYFLSDLHLGHEAILNFEKEFRSGATWEENAENILNNISEIMTKRDTLYLLGDVVLSKKEKDSRYWLHRIDMIPGRKILIRGNHDLLDLTDYIRVFDEVYGLYKFKGYWLSHAPIHPDELRGKKNIHGHVHRNSITKLTYSCSYGCLPPIKEIDDRYISVCCEALGERPINFNDIVSGKYWEIKKT